MLTYVYRSKKKQETYLYLVKRDDFSTVPDGLKAIFGQPEFVCFLNLTTKNKLARIDINALKQSLTSQGYFFQPPPEKNIDQIDLFGHAAADGKSSNGK